MNLIKAAELLKGAPDSELTQYLQNPTGNFPEYLVASEIKRREIMREKYAAANQGQPTKTSIIEELLQKDNQQMRQQPQQLPEAMGIGSVPPPEGMQLTPAPMMEAAQQQPQQFYDGGVVALAEGGSLEDAIQEYLRPNVSENKGMQSAGINPSIPVGAGSMDLSAAYNRMGDDVPTQSNVTGRIGGSYPMGGGRLSAGIQGIHAHGHSGVTGYDVGYSDEKNRLMANINPTPHGAALGASYGRQLDNESAINAMLMRDPRGHMSGNLMYTRRFAAGDLVQSKPDLSAFDIDTKLMQPQAITEVKELADYQKQMADLVGPSSTEGYQDALAKQRGEIESRKKNYLSDFLIRSGLGMASSKSIHPLQAAAQGLAGGFEDYQKSKEQNAAAERSLTDSEFKFKQAQRAESMGLLGLSRQAMSDAMSDRRAGQEAARSSEALRIQAAIGKNNAINQAAQLGISEKELVLRTKEIAAAAQRHKETMAMEENRIKAQIERDNAITPAIRTQAANVVSDAITRYRNKLEESPPEWYTNAQAKIDSLANNPVAQQVEMQRLENRIRMNSGLSSDILKIAGFN
jgi:hypothetical protein